MDMFSSVRPSHSDVDKVQHSLSATEENDELISKSYLILSTHTLYTSYFDSHSYVQPYDLSVTQIKKLFWVLRLHRSTNRPKLGYRQCVRDKVPNYIPRPTQPRSAVPVVT